MTLSRSVRRAFLAASVSLAPMLTQQALAQDAVVGRGADALVLSSDSLLDRLLLPYSPLIFDTAVLFGRSFVEITYVSRAYDPLTESFSVSGLHLRRPGFDMRIERMRVDPSSTLMQGLAVDTSQFPLPPEARGALDQLGLQTVRGDVVLDYSRNDARAAYSLDIGMDFPQIGTLQARAVVDGFHVLVPLETVDYEAPPTDTEGFEDVPSPPSPPPRVTGTLRDFSATYHDDGLLDVVLGFAAQSQGVTLDQMAAGVGAMLSMGVGPALDDLPGGASPALRERAQGWTRAADSFIQGRSSIRIDLDPLEPVSFERLQSGAIDEATILALNPSVDSPAPSPLALAVPDAASDPLGAANALLEGRGVLQDREAGARALLELAESGDAQALAALAAGFGSGAVPDLPPPETTRLMQFLLVARAAGLPVADSVLSALEGRVPAAERRNVEISAAQFFRASTPEGRAAVPVSPENIASYTPGRLRALAFDAYEGVNNAPRDRTEAYALALVASAAGDRVAEVLRDDLAAAAQAGRITLSVDEARTRAAPLWEAFRASATAAPATP